MAPKKDISIFDPFNGENWFKIYARIIHKKCKCEIRLYQTGLSVLYINSTLHVPMFHIVMVYIIFTAS